jgi:hypothetical protein
MPDSLPETTATPILKSVETINGTTDLTAEDLNPSQIFADAEQANIELAHVVTPAESIAIVRRDDNDERNQNAMTAAETRIALEDTPEKIKVEMTAAQINDMFRQDRLEDLISDFFQRRLPKLYRILWGKKAAEAADALLGLVPDIDGNKLLKFYFEERNRQAKTQQQGAVESVRKLNPDARGIKAGQSGRVRLVRKEPGVTSEGNFTMVKIPVTAN